MKKIFWISIILFLLLASAGPLYFHQGLATDLSIFIIEDEKEEEEIIPRDEDLSYIDTETFMRIMSMEFICGCPTSDMRETYYQYPADWDIVIIDSRDRSDFNEGHINGAINIPDEYFMQYDHLLPEDKGKRLIFYCDGLHCPLSKSSARKAMELGYTDVYVYQEGTDFWMAAGNYLTATEEHIKDLIKDSVVSDGGRPPYLLIDTRSYNDYLQEHIPHSISMEAAIFREKFLRAMPQDRGVEIITYCDGFACEESHAVASYLVSSGYTNVKTFAGGMRVWKAAGLPLFGLESTGGDFDITAGQIHRGLSPEEFLAKQAEGAVIVDVRRDDEREGGFIKGSLHLPLQMIEEDLEAARQKLPESTTVPLLFHCAAGLRAQRAVAAVEEMGYSNLFFLEHTIRIADDGSFEF